MRWILLIFKSNTVIRYGTHTFRRSSDIFMSVCVFLATPRALFERSQVFLFFCSCTIISAIYSFAVMLRKKATTFAPQTIMFPFFLCEKEKKTTRARAGAGGKRKRGGKEQRENEEQRRDETLFFSISFFWRLRLHHSRLLGVVARLEDVRPQHVGLGAGPLANLLAGE
jgi:hypothetical protein